MYKLENKTLQKFLDNFIGELKLENISRESSGIEVLDIPFIVSSLYQSFSSNIAIYEDFINDLGTYKEYTFYILNSRNDYNGIIDVQINLVRCDHNNLLSDYDCPDYDYQIYFSYDERNYSCCQCTPDMPDYREDKHCCGHGCDASFCKFSLNKVLHITSDSWEGDEHDYWEFEDKFYINDKELADKKEEEDRQILIMELKNMIETAQKELAELEKI